MPTFIKKMYFSPTILRVTVGKFAVYRAFHNVHRAYKHL